uniref:Uncharacterized protein n=1 Tax=Trichuris muris TaxID=70415 RepID=A0A5S6QUR3_TRIMR
MSLYTTALTAAAICYVVTLSRTRSIPDIGALHSRYYPQLYNNRPYYNDDYYNQFYGGRPFNERTFPYRRNYGNHYPFMPFRPSNPYDHWSTSSYSRRYPF